MTIHVTDVDEAPMAVGSSDRTVEYTENDTSSVLTLSARDPEGATPIVWSILGSVSSGVTTVVDDDILDAADFGIDQGGVLTFDVKPDYDNPADSNTNNVYQVVVQASDGNTSGYVKVTVNVQDVEEEGSVRLGPTGQEAATLLQPQVGVGITAHSVTDPDGNASTARGTSDINESDTTWQWYRSSSKRATGTAISSVTVGSTGTEAAYTPVAADVNHHLRVVATYTDGRGDGKTAVAVSEYKTLSGIASNTAPEFPATTIIWVVLEGTDAGRSIGNPVTATDSDSGERLTYWLTGTDGSKFNIDAMTGQLKVKDNLNYETPEDNDGTTECRDDACAVTVNVVDSSGSVSDTDTIDVTIRVTGVDEKPTFGPGPTTIIRAEGALADNFNEVVATYTASDPESASVTMSLSGVDASKFELNDLASPVAGSKVLAFKDNPDFEMPGDGNQDNVYQVTVVASDGVNSAMRDVIVKVTDMAEDGTIEVAPSQPRVGTALTATLTDSDGVMAPTWKWRKAAMTDIDCDTLTDWPATTLIKDAESATYTPVSEDDGHCLRVEVSYLDMNYVSTDNAGFAKSETFVLAGKVQGSSTNIAPMFASATAMRYVRENSDAGVNVGGPVTAKDSDTLEYVLSGADAGLFTVQADDSAAADVDEGGQIQVKAGAMLDHETKPTLTVTVTATDPRGATDTITVTIKVTDVDEAPRITEGGLAVSGPMNPDYLENGTDAVGTYTASGPEAASATWTLEGADMGDFTITGGILNFRSSPDYEMPMDMGEDNAYMVTVKATGGTIVATHDVTVTVGNVDEPGTVTLMPASPMVGTAVTATLTDLDGATTSESWDWWISDTEGGDLHGDPRGDHGNVHPDG